MVKAEHSVYLTNKRPNCWIKIKPEYVDNLSDDMDIVIVGGFYSEGKRRGGLLNAFLCAVAEDTEQGKKPVMFYTFCKFGTGMTDIELAKIKFVCFTFLFCLFVS